MKSPFHVCELLYEEQNFEPRKREDGSFDFCTIYLYTCCWHFSINMITRMPNNDTAKNKIQEICQVMTFLLTVEFDS